MEGKQMSQEQVLSQLLTFGGLALAGIIALIPIVFIIIISWKIFSKAGYSGALGLLMFVPIANIIVLCVLAFSEWPIYRELNRLRRP
jgi:uncharacterized membrane protein